MFSRPINYLSICNEGSKQEEDWMLFCSHFMFVLKKIRETNNVEPNTYPSLDLSYFV